MFNILVLNLVCAQDWDWMLKATGHHQIAGSSDISVDNKGNCVIAGYYQKSMILDGHSLYTDDDYYSDMFLGRTNSEGKVLWLKSIDAGDTYNDYIGVTQDDDSNIYLTGSQNGRIFVSKYDSTGVLIWKNNFDNEHYGYGRDIAIDQYDNVYVIGGGGWNFFLAKLNYYGRQEWTKDIQVNSSNGFNPNDIAVDSRGNLYFAATFGVDSIKLDDIVIKQKGSDFWGKVSPEGTFLWAKAAKGRTTERPQIALTPDDDIYISGAFSVSMSIEGTTLEGLCCSNPKPYIARYDSSGNLKWAKTGNTTYEAKGRPTDIKVDLDGNLYLTGEFFTCSGTPGSCTENDFYIEKYNNSGNVLWRKEFRSSGFDSSHAIDFDNNGFVYSIGNTTMSDNFVDKIDDTMVNSICVLKLNTNAPTLKRPERPEINRLQYICRDVSLFSLVAKGQNVKWYDNVDMQRPIYSGGTYEKNFQFTDTLYVTQTINSVESWPKEVIVYKADLSSEFIKYNRDTLYVTNNDFLSYKWSYNGDPIENAGSYYCIPLENGVYSVELLAGDCSVALNYDFKRPNMPKIDSLRYVCNKESVGTLDAVGENVIWYSSETYADTLFVGNQYNPVINSDKVYYVRQTVNGIASFPKKTEIKFSTLKDSVLRYDAVSLFVTDNKKFKYQWYYEDSLIENEASYRHVPQKNGLYSVVISDSICSKTLSRYFVQQPRIDSNIYYVCPGENMPVIHAEGKDLVWTTFSYEEMKYDTISLGTPFIPEFSNTRVVYLTQSENGFSSYPLAISIVKADFSSLKIDKSSSRLQLTGNNSQYYNCSWYLNNDIVASSELPYIYNPYFGRYKVKVSLANKCDTTFYFEHQPAFDSIYYVCTNNNPNIYLNSYNIRWYSDKELTKLISISGNFYPVLNGVDSMFYIAQVRNNSEVVWKGKIEVVYPKLDKLQIIHKNNRLEINSPKPYYTYVWRYHDSILDSENYYCVPDKKGTYKVDVEAGTCRTSLIYNNSVTAIEVPEFNTIFKIYPNPVSDFLVIETDNKDIDVNLFSINGYLLFSKHYTTSPIRINVNSLNKGVYILRLKTSSGLINRRIIKL